jgi:segregation and condensation protein A
MQDYRVQLDVYHGPLDLLLHLIKRNEVDIHQIPVARITEQYLEYVRTLQSLDINLAGEFLVMAATLMEVKSAMMGPAEETGDDDSEESLTSGDDPADPRYELVQQLLAYKRFKDAAQALERRRESFAARFPRQPPPFKQDQDEQAPPELDMEDVSVWDLLEAFNNLMEQLGAPSQVEMVDDDTPIELHAEDIVDRLGRDGPTTLQDMFAGRQSVAEMIGLFLATLELLRQRRVRALQDNLAGQIRLELRPEAEWQANQPEEDEGAANLRFDPDEPDNFEWPDEETRKRYARRVERRKRGERVEEDEQLAQDIAELEAEQQQERVASGETSGDHEGAEQ